MSSMCVYSEVRRSVLSTCTTQRWEPLGTFTVWTVHCEGVGLSEETLAPFPHHRSHSQITGLILRPLVLSLIPRPLVLILRPQSHSQTIILILRCQSHSQTASPNIPGSIYTWVATSPPGSQDTSFEGHQNPYQRAIDKRREEERR